MTNFYSIEIFLSFIVIVGIAVLVYYYLFSVKNVQKKKQDEYLKGLKYMAEGESRQAIHHLKEAVRQDSTNIDAYIKLANILQKENLVKNAIKIYKDLLLRENLNKEFENEISYHLAMALMQTENYENARTYFEKIHTDKKYSPKVIGHLIDMYENLGLWAKGFEALKKSPQSEKKQFAFFRMKMGKVTHDKGELKEARIIYKDAIKIDSKCADAYLCIGDSYVEEDRMDDAINTWTDFCKKEPDLAYLAFERLEKAWYEKGQFSKIEDLYQSLLKNDENNIHAIIALADIYRKKGEYNSALKILNDAQKRELDQDVINYNLIKIHHDNGKYNQASKLALALLEKYQQ